ncbi:MAG: response regulator [Acidimicrobiia bacterium]|nr:response regulator [Acidimicrobiia bacterium]MBV9039371.1 response regulator [Acidimicrobiia bacterium]
MRANVLVADDTPANVLAIEQVLEPLQHNVVTASSGDEVLRALLKAEFAVILLDVHMPIMDGFEVAAQIKAREKTRHVPIIFLTAINQAPSDVFQGYEAGAVDYLSKPVEPWLVRAKVGAFVDIWLEHKRIERLQSDLAMAEQRQQQALQINEGIVQGIAVAKMALELDDHERALDTLDRTLTAAKRVISHLLLDSVDEIQPSDLRAAQ